MTINKELEVDLFIINIIELGGKKYMKIFVIHLLKEKVSIFY